MSENGGKKHASYIDNYQLIATSLPLTQWKYTNGLLTMVLQSETYLVVMLSTKNELSEIEYCISKTVAYWGKINSISNHPPFAVKT